MSRNNGGPAFPGQEINQNHANGALNEGMSLRDYFAVHANSKDVDSFIAFLGKGYTNSEERCGVIVKARYAYADAMIKEREEK